MENKLTAVEWLMKELSYDNGFGVRHPTHNEFAHLNEYFDKAKEMEKQQQGEVWDEAIDEDSIYTTFEQYIEETYGK